MRTVAGMLGVMGLLSPMAMCQAFLVPAGIRARECAPLQAASVGSAVAGPAEGASAGPLDQLGSFFNNLLSPSGGSSATTGGAGAAKKEYTVVVSGASGLIGTALSSALARSTIGGQPVKVLKLVRKGSRGPGEVEWDPYAGSLDLGALEGVDAIVHLAGENVGSGSDDSLLGRLGAWTDKKKEKILESRRVTTGLLASAISKLKRPPKVFLTASAVGYYGFDQGEATFDETGRQGNGFLAEVTRVWEAEAAKAKAKGVRVVNTRFGVVLSKQGGIVAKLLPIFFLGGGGVIGDGRQYLSWVTLRDAVRAIQFLLQAPSVSGPVNVVSPNPVTNKEFTDAFGRALIRPTVLPFPAVAAKGLFGEMGDEMLLGGQRVVPTKLQAAGFKFEDPDIGAALVQALKE